jgi:dihydrofolate reductase
MRRITLFEHVTADGYFARADGALDWMEHDEDVGRASMESAPANDTMLFGRKTYEMFELAWAKAGAEGPHGGPMSPGMKRMAAFINEGTKIVFSRTLAEVTWRNSRLVRELDPGAIAAMKREPGQNILVFGSGSIASQLTEAGLIDDYQLVISPILLGGGRSMIEHVGKTTKLALVDCRSFPSGRLLVRYTRAG